MEDIGCQQSYDVRMRAIKISLSRRLTTPAENEMMEGVLKGFGAPSPTGGLTLPASPPE
jgi:hypothetical protein